MRVSSRALSHFVFSQVKLALRFIARQCLMFMTSKVGHCPVLILTQQDHRAVHFSCRVTLGFETPQASTPTTKPTSGVSKGFLALSYEASWTFINRRNVLPAWRNLLINSGIFSRVNHNGIISSKQLEINRNPEAEANNAMILACNCKDASGLLRLLILRIRLHCCSEHFHGLYATIAH